MPTFERPRSFVREWRGLTPVQQHAFLDAVGKLVADMRAGRPFGGGLRVKGVRGARGIYELTWAPDGRATFEYGPEQRLGETHVIWRRIGTHEILRAP